MINETLQQIAECDGDIYTLEATKRKTEKLLQELRTERDHLENLVIQEMQDTGCLQVEEGGFKWGLRNNPPKAKVMEEDKVPEKFWKIKRELDKKLLNAAVLHGECVPGVTIDNGSVSLTCHQRGK